MNFAVLEAPVFPIISRSGIGCPLMVAVTLLDPQPLPQQMPSLPRCVMSSVYSLPGSSCSDSVTMGAMVALGRDPGFNRFDSPAEIIRLEIISDFDLVRDGATTGFTLVPDTKPMNL